MRELLVNKIYVYKINGENIAVVATSNYTARHGLDQKYGTEVPKLFQFECSDVVQVQGIFQIDAGPEDVKSIDEEPTVEIKQEETNA